MKTFDLIVTIRKGRQFSGILNTGYAFIKFIRSRGQWYFGFRCEALNERGAGLNLLAQTRKMGIEDGRVVFASIDDMDGIMNVYNWK